MIFKDLAPSWELLNSYKKGKINQEEYEKIYTEEVLNKIKPEDIFKQIDNSILLCWEGKEKFCHRYIVAKWLWDTLNIEVIEILKKRLLSLFFLLSLKFSQL